MTDTLNTETTMFRLSARWMDDHLDCCGPDYWGGAMPEGERTKLFWTGRLTDDQVIEIVSRADYYDSFEGVDRQDSRSLCAAARTVLKQLSKQASHELRKRVSETRGLTRSTRRIFA